MKKVILVLLLLLPLAACSTQKEMLLRGVTEVVKEDSFKTEVLIGTPTKDGLIDMALKQNPGDPALLALQRNIHTSAVRVMLISEKMKEIIIASHLSKETEQKLIAVLNKAIEIIQRE